MSEDMQGDKVNKEVRNKVPPLWILAILVVFSLMSENIYSPSLPSVEASLKTTSSAAQRTLSIYLVGVAFGMSFWGILSDKIGRKPSVLLGLTIYIVGCVLCSASKSINFLLLARIIQAIGASSISLLAQTISRESFKGEELIKAFAFTNSFIAMAPAFGPLIGGFLAEYYGWRASFTFLIIMAAVAFPLVVLFLPETRVKEESMEKFRHVAKKMFKDKRFLTLCFLTSLAQGSFMSYNSEGPFIFIELLGLAPSMYGKIFSLFAVNTIFGGMTTNMLRKKVPTLNIVRAGAAILLLTNLFFLLVALWHIFINNIGDTALISLLLSSRFVTFFGASLFMTSIMPIILSDYRSSIGTASSIFGLTNYMLISIFSFVMSEIHNDTLLPMPIYFVVMNIAMLCLASFARKKFIN